MTAEIQTIQHNKGTDSAAYNAFETLGYSQLLPLLGLPEEDRQELAEENELSA